MTWNRVEILTLPVKWAMMIEQAVSLAHNPIGAMAISRRLSFLSLSSALLLLLLLSLEGRGLNTQLE